MKRALSLDEPLVPEPAQTPAEDPSVILSLGRLKRLNEAAAASIEENARLQQQVRQSQTELQVLQERKARESATAAFPRSPLTCNRFEPTDRFLERCLGCGGPRVGHSEAAIRRWVEWSSQQGRRRR